MKKINWLRIFIFAILLFSVWEIFSQPGGNGILKNIPLIIIFWPFWLAVFLGDNMFAFGVALILEMIWLYFIASILSKIITALFDKIKSRNKVV